MHTTTSYASQTCKVIRFRIPEASANDRFEKFSSSATHVQASAGRGVLELYLRIWENDKSGRQNAATRFHESHQYQFFSPG
jgi:hypothetical protein